LVSEEERILLRLAEGEAAHLKLAAIGPLRVRQPPRVSRGPSRPPSVEPVTPTADR
jgi:hypothetical protein